jgi:hypothetical protein
MDARNDLFIVLGFFVLLWVAWVVTGGPERALTGRAVGGGISSPNTSSGFVERDIREAQRELEDLEEQVERARLEGIASPFRGQVSFAGGDPDNTFSLAEYVRIRASSRNTAPITITGWQIESLVTGVRFTIGGASPLLRSGVVNAEPPVQLAPGGSAIINSGRSLVGASFRVNKCSGYLDQHQRFIPRLSKQCPRPLDEFKEFGMVPITSIQSDDDEYQVCYDYIRRNVNRCEIKTGRLKDSDDLHDQCVAFIKNELTYNGCTSNHRFDSDFYSNEWRLHLGSFVELWREDYEILRLLDQNGLVVDVWQY